MTGCYNHLPALARALLFEGVIILKIKLFTHTDLDGVGAAVIGKAFYGHDINISYCEYGNVNKKVKRFIKSTAYKYYDKVFIVDISLNEEVAELIENTHPEGWEEGFNLGEMFQLLDHHPTAEWMNKYFWAKVTPNIARDKKNCGTWMLHEYLLENEEEYDNGIRKNVEGFADIVRQYDTWEWKTKTNNPFAKQLNDLLDILGKKKFIEKFSDQIKHLPNIFINETDKLLLELRQEEIDRYVYRKSKEMIIRKLILDPEVKYNVGFVFAERFRSELGNELCESNEEIDFVVMIDLSRAISYRTTSDNIDLGDVASIFGGGGHPKAAGSEIEGHIREKILKLLFEGANIEE